MIHLVSKQELGFPEKILIEAALAALRIMDASNADLTVVITTDEEIKKLNREYRGIESATDVLSFPAGEIDPETQHDYLGDIIISMPRARRQAMTQGYPVENEIRLLVVHGVLHLFGYDHADENDKTHMWNLQKKILAHIGITHPEMGGEEPT